jgi:hypothetical protein
MRLSANYKGQRGRNLQVEISGADLEDADAVSLVEALSNSLMNKSAAGSTTAVTFYDIQSINKTAKRNTSGKVGDNYQDTNDVNIKYSADDRDYYVWLTLDNSVTQETISEKFAQHMSLSEDALEIEVKPSTN